MAQQETQFNPLSGFPKLEKLDAQIKEIARTKGYGAALTELHKNLEILEKQAFESKSGWKPELWRAISELRSQARTLWENAILESPTSAAPAIRKFK